jgi:SAM-dependent methyltransferase
MAQQQKWKVDPELHSCEREDGKKTLDYYETYVKEFLDADPLRDWESIERCKELWEFFLTLDVKLPKKCGVLDCGTKDGQFPAWLVEQGYDAIGIEISEPYVEYAVGRNRPVEHGDVCKLHFKDRSFNVAFAHHLLGLVPDYQLAYEEMIRTVKAGGYIITLDNIPGNPRKHFQLVESAEQLSAMVDSASLNVGNGSHAVDLIFFDYYPRGFEKGREFLTVLQRKRGAPRKKKE